MHSYLNDRHINSLLSQGTFRALPGDRADQLARYIESLPWTNSGTRLDWSRIPNHARVQLAGDIPSDSIPATQALIHAPVLILVYNEREAVAGETRQILEKLDELVWHAPGPRYLVGACHKGDDYEIVPGVVAEYDGADTITIATPASGGTG